MANKVDTGAMQPTKGFKKSYLLKQITDRLFALGLLLIFSPLLLVIIISLKLEAIFFPEARSPVFVSELRVSKGKVFRLYKFRKLKKSVLDRLKDKEPGTYSYTQFQRNPDNLTHTGKFLKQVYFDEFPQLLNVLKGDISLVGPRSHILQKYKQELKQGIIYAKIMPCGLTGLVAITKDLPQEKKKTDAEYFQKYSTYHPLKLLFYDMSIIIKTAQLVFRARGR